MKVSHLELNFDERNEIKGIGNVEVVEIITEPPHPDDPRYWTDGSDNDDDEEPMDD